MTGPDLTQRQRNIIQIIADSTQHYGYAPTMREIGEARCGAREHVECFLPACQRW